MNSVGAGIKVTGYVQGVGYRYFCIGLARNLQLAGCVRNLPDGSVTIEVEGDKDSIENFISHLNSGPHHARVEKVAVDWKESSGKFGNFEIEG